MSRERLVDVALPGAAARGFTYRVPDALDEAVAAGSRVEVPFRKGVRIGIVLGDATHPGGGVKLRDVARAIDGRPALPTDVVELLIWAARYYAVPLGELLRNACPAAVFKDTGVRRRKVREDVDAHENVQVDGHEHVHVQVQLHEHEHEQVYEHQLEHGHVKVMLNRDQRDAVDGIVAAIGTHARFLLFGVTGSGKTEVYLRVIERALMAGQSAIVLVPEIALTPQLADRFRARFGDAVAVLHSGLTPGTRAREWRRAARFETPFARVVVGARSAVFAPVRDFGVIVVDEEHDGSYRQEEGLPYNARDLAVMRARVSRAVVVLGSATPSLETFRAARDGRFTMLHLPSRVSAQPLPTVEWVDLRRAPRAALTDLLTNELTAALRETRARGEQAILYLDRRGSSPAVVCQSCGAITRCEACESPFVHHRAMAKLVCHTCGAIRPVPGTCAVCGSSEIAFMGVGIEKVEAALNERLPELRTLRLDRDAVKGAAALDRTLQRFANLEADVLLGTRMVTKGHDFPRVTLVGVLLADQGLARPDFRAAERTFQILVQVAGRAGRLDRPGRVIVQAFDVDHPAVRLAATHSVELFLERELAIRARLRYPPATRLVIVEGRAALASIADAAIAQIRAQLGCPSGVTLIGPTPAARRRIAGAYRAQLLCKVDALGIRALTERLVAIRESLGGSRSVRVDIQVDPYVLT